MKPRRTIIVATFSILQIASVASAQESSASGLAQAQVIEGISVTSLEDMRFGPVAVSSVVEGQVILEPSSGVVRYHGGASEICANELPCKTGPAIFVVRGEANRNYNIFLPNDLEALGTKTGQVLPVTDLSIAAGGLVSDNRSRLNGAGEDLVHVGGTLWVPASTSPDRFTASFTVSVIYD